MRLQDAIDGFLLARAADGLAAGTLTTYRWALAKFAECSGDCSNEALTKEHAQRYMAAMRAYQTQRGAGLAFKSLENVWIALRAFDTWRVKELHAARFFEVERPTGGYDQPVPFTDDELRRLLKAAQFTKPAATTRRKAFAMKRHTAQRDTAMLLLMLDTGLRAGEVARLTVADVDLQTGAVLVRAHGSGKKTRSRFVFLGARSRKSVWKLTVGRKPDDWLFSGRDDAPLTPNSVMKLYHGLGQRSGIAGAHPHRMRHTFAVEYLRRGGDVFTLQRLLGHSSLEMVRRYVAIADGDAQRVHARASPVDGWHL